MIQEEFLECLTLKFKAIRSFETTRIIYLTTQRDVLELNGQQHRCESLKYRIVLASAAALTQLRIFKPQDRQCTYNVTIRCVRLTTDVIELLTYSMEQSPS